MMDKKNGNGMGMMCACGCGMGGGHRLFYLLRVLVTIIILMIVFWCGVAVGVLNGASIARYSMIRSGFGSGMMLYGANGATSTAAGTAGGTMMGGSVGY